MTINLIVAHGNNREIGANNQLLWKLPADMKRFKELTIYHTVVMGSKTAWSIGGALPNRTNIILTRNPLSGKHPSSISIREPSLDAILHYSKDRDIFIIGGAEVYKALLPYADRLYITRVEAEFPKADTFFPEYYSLLDNYKVIDYIRQQDGDFDTTYLVYDKK